MAISTDILILGPLVFIDFSPPERMPFGGKQAMAVHKYIGGSRVIDTTGPDDMDIHWSGFFFGEEAMANARTLDALRIAGAPLPLAFGGLAYVVVIADCQLSIRRLPNWVEYDITCVVVSDGAQGDLSAFQASADDLVSADISAAQAITALPAAVASSVANFASAYAAATPLAVAPVPAVSAAGAAASSALAGIVAAIPGAGGALDGFSATGPAASVASGLLALLTAAQTQTALVDAQGLIGRASASLGQAGV
jgi:hypothetical protein